MRVRSKWGRLALLGAALALPAAAQEPLEQGWSPQERAWWYSVTQGSRLLPESWLRALEQAGGTALFLAPEHMRALRYIPRDGLVDGKPMLPIGFAIDRQPDRSLARTRLRWFEGQGIEEPWVGMNCAACHTAEIAYRGRRLRIEGAPALADFQSFRETVIRALAATKAEPAKFDRFAGRVLAGRDTAGNRAMLAEALAQLIAWEELVERQSASPLRYGFGRLDAVGHILNKVALVAEAQQTPTPADAPVSYPFIWNTPQHDRVQWNGVAKNSARPLVLRGQRTDLGALGRNTGQIIGVFGDVRIGTGVVRTYDSSAQVENLIAIERLVGRLKSPAWPAHVFGAVDAAKAQRGARLFGEKCAGCHAPLSRENLTSRVTARMLPLSKAGTDIWMACNAYLHQAQSGLLRGALQLDGSRIKERDDGLRLLTASVTGVLVHKTPKIARTLWRDLFGHPAARAARIRTMTVDAIKRNPALAADPAKLARAAQCRDAEQALNEAAARGEAAHLLAYKARPLNGIWATAPYLHNGSVPTLYDLLLPAGLRPLFAPEAMPVAQGDRVRPERFFLGTREYDPVKVGYRTEPSAENSFEFRTKRPDGAEILGNSNAGHDYGNAALSDEDRWAIVEYLKTL